MPFPLYAREHVMETALVPELLHFLLFVLSSPGADARLVPQVPSWSEFLTRDDFLGVTTRGRSGRIFLVTTR